MRDAFVRSFAWLVCVYAARKRASERPRRPCTRACHSPWGTNEGRGPTHRTRTRTPYSVYSLFGPGSGGNGTVGGSQRGLLGLLVLLLLLLHGRHLLRLAQAVHSDGQEDVEQRVVAEHGQKDEVEGVDEALARASLRLDAVVHHLVPILASEDLHDKMGLSALSSLIVIHLEDRQHGDEELVEVCPRLALFEVERASEKLHTQQCEDQDKEEEEQEQGDDALHGAQEGDDQVAQRGPVAKNRRRRR